MNMYLVTNKNMNKWCLDSPLIFSLGWAMDRKCPTSAVQLISLYYKTKFSCRWQHIWLLVLWSVKPGLVKIQPLWVGVTTRGQAWPGSYVTSLHSLERSFHWNYWSPCFKAVLIHLPWINYFFLALTYSSDQTVFIKVLDSHHHCAVLWGKQPVFCLFRHPNSKT